MSNFEPNAVIRGFQLTVVGSMFVPCADRQESTAMDTIRCQAVQDEFA